MSITTSILRPTLLKDDYIKDGLLYCRKCGEARQRYVGKYKATVPCKCEGEDYGEGNDKRDS